MKEFRVIIAGSREFTDYPLLKEKCDNILKKKLEDKDTKVIIVSGHARGADTLGEEYAREKGLECETYPANWDKYGKSAGFKRNTLMASLSNGLIAFLKPKVESKGTMMMIRIARENNLLTRVVEEKE
jgi:predicted Rossmann fold nucleotide-binding protein DprA/Smf involved in DNA uptake